MLTTLSSHRRSRRVERRPSSHQWDTNAAYALPRSIFECIWDEDGRRLKVVKQFIEMWFNKDFKGECHYHVGTCPRKWRCSSDKDENESLKASIKYLEAIVGGIDLI